MIRKMQKQLHMKILNKNLLIDYKYSPKFVQIVVVIKYIFLYSLDFRKIVPKLHKNAEENNSLGKILFLNFF